MYVIGITGGIASGKSHVVDVISKMGYEVIDSDKISYELSLKGNKVYNEIINTFGEEYVLSNGEIDRKKLGRLIFNSEKDKQKLNEISHPYIIKEIKKRLKESQGSIVFLDIPLLYEAKLEYLCDKIICVYLDKTKQIERLMARDGIDYEYALKKINSQIDLQIKAKQSYYIINSYGSLEQTETITKNLIEKIKGELYGSH
ncbi:TPA: dephospho-CoA kinase [Candidatus Avacholeplasma faecigallinarum]|nr:dephospho-CoA kinase [Candidatus Avacholeplasma faecigallinarum]